MGGCLSILNGSRDGSQQVKPMPYVTLHPDNKPATNTPTTNTPTTNTPTTSTNTNNDNTQQKAPSPRSSHSDSDDEDEKITQTKPKATPLVPDSNETQPQPPQPQPQHHNHNTNDESYYSDTDSSSSGSEGNATTVQHKSTNLITASSQHISFSSITSAKHNTEDDTSDFSNKKKSRESARSKSSARDDDDNGHQTDPNDLVECSVAKLNRIASRMAMHRNSSLVDLAAAELSSSPHTAPTSPANYANANTNSINSQLSPISAVRSNSSSPSVPALVPLALELSPQPKSEMQAFSLAPVTPVGKNTMMETEIAITTTAATTATTVDSSSSTTSREQNSTTNTNTTTNTTHPLTPYPDFSKKGTNSRNGNHMVNGKSIEDSDNGTLSSVLNEDLSLLEAPVNFHALYRDRQESVIDGLKLLHHRRNSLKDCIREFNRNAKRGIKMLEEGKFFSLTAKNIATFLYEMDGLSRKQVGEYLGKNNEVLKEYVELFDFTAIDFDDALRVFLMGFQLPGEAQIIDRIMENFSHRFVSCNPEGPLKASAAYVLAFSIIMLNTDLHSPNVKHKMTLGQFLRNCNGIDDGQSLPVGFLSAIYERISENELKFNSAEENMTVFCSPQKQGWLMKEGGRIKTHKRRWFILKDACLYYFSTPEDESPKGIVPLVPELAVKIVNPNRFSFEIFCDDKRSCGGAVKSNKRKSDGRVVVGQHSSFVFRAENHTELTSWVEKIEAALMTQRNRLTLSRKMSHGNIQLSSSNLSHSSSMGTPFGSNLESVVEESSDLGS